VVADSLRASAACAALIYVGHAILCHERVELLLLHAGIPGRRLSEVSDVPVEVRAALLADVA
jgi:hypothetical protein